VGEEHDARRNLTPEQEKRRRRRSLALAVVLAFLAVLFYVMALIQGPGVVDRPL
jgi:ferric-dicitrate binding protein FerR (iron transport regulator)